MLLNNVLTSRAQSTEEYKNIGDLKMQKSIWSVASEVVKYNAIRPEHPVAIVDNVVRFLKTKYMVNTYEPNSPIILMYFLMLGSHVHGSGCRVWDRHEHQESVWQV